MITTVKSGAALVTVSSFVLRDNVIPVPCANVTSVPVSLLSLNGDPFSLNVRFVAPLPDAVSSAAGAHCVPLNFKTCPFVAFDWFISRTLIAPLVIFVESTTPASRLHVAPDALTVMSPLSPSVTPPPVPPALIRAQAPDL